MNASRLRELKERTQMTCQQISDISGVPVATVTRLLSGQTPNPSLDAVTEIVKAMGGSVDDIVDIPPKKENKLEDSERLIMLYREALATRDRIIRYKNRWIRALVIICLLFLLLTASYTVFDVLHTDIGFIT